MQTTPSNTADDMVIQGVTQIHLTNTDTIWGYSKTSTQRHTHIQKEI